MVWAVLLASISRVGAVTAWVDWAFFPTGVEVGRARGVLLQELARNNSMPKQITYALRYRLMRKSGRGIRFVLDFKVNFASI